MICEYGIGNKREGLHQREQSLRREEIDRTDSLHWWIETLAGLA